MYSTKYAAIFYLVAAAASSIYVALRTIPTPYTREAIFNYLAGVLVMTLAETALPYRVGPLKFLRKWRRLFWREEREKQQHRLKEWQLRDVEKQQQGADIEPFSDSTSTGEKSTSKFLTLTPAPTVQAYEDDPELDTWMGISMAKWGLSMRLIYSYVMASHILSLGTFAELLCTLGSRQVPPGSGDSGDAISTILEMLPRADGTELETVALVRIWITHFSLAFVVIGMIESIRQNKKYIQPRIDEIFGPRLNLDDYKFSVRWIALFAYISYFSFATMYALAIFADIIVGHIFLSASMDNIGTVGRGLSSIWSTHVGIPTSNLSQVFDLSTSWTNTLVILPLALMMMMDIAEKIFYLVHKPVLPKSLFEPAKRDGSVFRQLIPESERDMLVRPGREYMFWLEGVPIGGVLALWTVLASYSCLLSCFSKAV